MITRDNNKRQIIRQMIDDRQLESRGSAPDRPHAILDHRPFLIYFLACISDVSNFHVSSNGSI